MRVGIAVLLLFVAVSSGAADPVYLDELIETPLASLQTQFPDLRREGCYRLADGHFLQITMDRKDGKPWRVTFASVAPCRRADDGPAVEIRHRSGIALGDSTGAILEKLGRPDASAAPDPAQRRLGDTEYFYICRVSEGCARHTSIFIKDGLVSAISEWYSE
jgi:hypothetical protein